MRFVDVQNDVAFHKIFGNADKPDALIAFLNAVLFPRGDNRIVNAQVEHPYLFPRVLAGKTSIINVEVTDAHGRVDLVEVQVADQNGFEKRKWSYLRVAMERKARGSDRPMRIPTIWICMLDFSITPGQGYFSTIETAEDEENEILFKNARYYLIELAKFDIQVDALIAPLENWIYFIKNAHQLDEIPSNVSDERLRGAYRDAEMWRWTKADLRLYDNFYVHLADLAQRELFLRKKANNAGRQEGIKEGRQEGLQEGRQEAVNEMLLSMHRSGLSIPQIAAISGKSEAEVTAIVASAE